MSFCLCELLWDYNHYWSEDPVCGWLLNGEKKCTILHPNNASLHPIGFGDARISTPGTTAQLSARRRFFGANVTVSHWRLTLNPKPSLASP
jgi:hypothetical protein